MVTRTNMLISTNGDDEPPPCPRKRTRTNALVRPASALLFCFGAAVMYGDVIGNAPSGTRAAVTSRIGERKNDYRRLVDYDSSAIYDSLHSTTPDKTPAMNLPTMPKPSVSDILISKDGTLTTYDLWLPEGIDDNTGLQHTPSNARPLVIMQTKPNNWMFGHDMMCCDIIRSYLDRGIAVASVVISTSTDLDGHQSTAMELMKSKAEQYGIDQNRITFHIDSASANIKRRVLGQGHDKNLENIVERTMMHWAAVPPTYENVPYIGKGSGGERKMDFWKADPIDENDTGRRPVVLYVHGGGWLAGMALSCFYHVVLLSCLLTESNIRFVSFQFSLQMTRQCSMDAHLCRISSTRGLALHRSIIAKRLTVPISYLSRYTTRPVPFASLKAGQRNGT